MSKIIDNYKGWDIYDSMPDGWCVDPSKTGSPIHDCVFIINGKSVFNGGKRALLKTDKKPCILPDPPLIVSAKFKQEQKPVLSDADLAEYPIVLSRLAREKFKQKLLAELIFDLKVCQLEGWNCLEYPYSLKALVDEVVSKLEITTKARFSNSHSQHKQLSLF